MPRISFAFFVVVALSLLAAAHYYVWVRVVRDASLPLLGRLGGASLIVVLGLGLPVGLVLSRAAEGFARPLVWATYVWMGLVFILVVFLGAGDAARALWHGVRYVSAIVGVGGTATPVDPERRVMLARTWAATVLTVTAGLGWQGMRTALAVPLVKRVRVELPRLAQALSGCSIVQLTDLHMGSVLARPWLEKVVAAVNALTPDVVVITGDLVDGSVPFLRDTVAPLQDLRARWGVYFVTGNHEYYSGVEAWIIELGRLGIKVLRNERVTIGSLEASFELAGIDDASAAQYGHGHGADLGRALKGYDRSRELVLLAHQPKAIVEAAPAGVGLVVSGHTHGGQIWPWGYLVGLTQPFVEGLHRVGDAQIYVSRGTGFWGPPMRLGAPPEITRLELIAPERLHGF